MRKKFCLFLFFIYVFAVSFTFSSSAESKAPVVLDFSLEDDYNLYYSNFNGCDVLWEDNAIHITSTQDLDAGEKGDPYVLLATDYLFNCDEYPYMKIKIKNLSDAPVFEMHFATDSSGGIVGASCTHVDITTKDTEYKEYVFSVPEKNLASMEVNGLPNEESIWTGEILQLRLDSMWIAEPSGQVPYGSEMYIEYVAFFQTEDDAKNFKIDEFRTARTPKPTASPTPVPTPTAEKTATPVKTTSQATKVPGTSTTPKDSNNMMPIIFGIVGAVVVVAIIAVVVIIKKKKK